MSAILITDIMTKTPICIEASTPIENALATMKEKGFQHIPILHKGKPKGVVSIRDLELTLSFYGSLGTRGAVSVDDSDNKTEPLLTVSPTETFQSVCSKMADQKVSAALVVEDNKVLGIFTATDAFRWIAKNC